MGVATAAIVGSAVVGGISNVIAGDRAAKESARARAQAGDQQAAAMLQMREAVERLEAEGVPSIEAQRIVLEDPQSVGLQDIHEIATSRMEDIQVDPRLREAQMQGLTGIEEIAETGVTAGEKAQEQQDYRTVAAEEQARRKAILQSMAERGVAGGGQELAALLQGSQAAAERRAQMQANLIQQREDRKLAALSQAAGLGSQIRGQEFGEQAQVASAADSIAKFNLANRMSVEAANLERQQRIADEQTRLANLQEQYNKDLIGRQYQQRMDKAKSIAAAKTGQAQQQMTQAEQTLDAGQAAAEGHLQTGSAIADLAGGIGKGIAQYATTPSPTKPPIPSPPVPGAPVAIPGMADGGVAPMSLPQTQGQPHSMSPPIQSPSGTGYAGGGVALIAEDTEIIPGDDFSGDRVDAKINSGEMVLNVEQQQRLMDLLKGYRSLSGLSNENIVEQPPIDNPNVELPQDLPSLPPPTIPQEQSMADGGIAPTKEELIRMQKLQEMATGMGVEAEPYAGGDVYSDKNRLYGLLDAVRGTEEDLGLMGQQASPEDVLSENKIRDYWANRLRKEIEHQEQWKPLSDLKYEDGGIAEERNDLFKKLSEEHNKMTTSEHQLKDAQKDTRAKIKALETLMGKK